MEVLDDVMDLDALPGSGVDLRAAKAAFLAAAAAAASGGAGRDVHRRPAMPLTVPSSKPRVDIGMIPPPSPHSGNAGAPSPLVGRMAYDQLTGSMGPTPDRGTALPLDLGALQQALLRNGGLNLQQHPAVILRLLMQAQGVSGGGGIPSCAVAQSNPRSSSGGSGGGSDHSNVSGAQGSFFGLPVGGGSAAVSNGRIAQSSAKGSGGVGSGLYGSTPVDGPLQGSRGNNGGSLASTYSAQPSNRSSGSGGSGVAGGGMSLDAKGFSSSGVTVDANVLKALLAANGPLNGSGLGIGPHTSAAVQSELSSAQLQSLLQHIGVGGGLGGGASGVPNGGGSSITLLNGTKGSGDGVTAAGGPSSVQQYIAQLAGVNGVDIGALAPVLYVNSAGGSGGSGNGLEALAALLKADIGSGSKGSASALGLLGPQVVPQLAALLQQQGITPEGLSKSSVLNSVLNGLGPVGGGGGAAAQLNHLLPIAVAGSRLPVGRMDGLDDPDVPCKSQSTAAAVAAAAAAVATAVREADGSGDGRGGVGGGSAAPAPASGRGNGGRPQRHSSSEVGISGCSGTNSKGPTGLQLLKSLVTSGAAGAGVAGLMNGSGGLADLSVLPGGVATQLMEDLESLGYRTGISQRVNSGTVSGTAGVASRTGDTCVRMGSTAPSNGVKSRFMPPGSPGVKKPNKRPENGSLATQILNRHSHAQAMQQASAGDPGNTAGGPPLGHPVVSPPPPPSQLLATAVDPAMMLGPGGAGVVSGLPGVLGSMPPAAATVAAGLPQVATTAALLATQPSCGVTSAALANAVASARNCGGATASGLLSGLTALSGGADAVLGSLAGGRLGSAGANASGGNTAAAHLRVLTLAGLSNSTAPAALLVASGLHKPHGLGASLLFEQPVPKGPRSRRTARAAGHMKIRSIMKDLGILSLKRGQADALQSERDARGESAHANGGDGSGSSGNSSDGGNVASGTGPQTRRQRMGGNGSGPTAASALQAAAAGRADAPAVPTASVAMAATGSRVGSGAGVGDAQLQAASSIVDSGSKCITGAAGSAAALAGLPWDLIARSTAAGVPLAAVVAKALGLQGAELAATTDGSNLTSGSAGTAAILSAAIAARAAATGAAQSGTSKPSVTVGTVNGVSLAARPPTAAPAAGPTGKSGQSSKAAAAATMGGSATASGAASATTKSRRKGGAPSRAAD
ncbi:hypothetical protein Vretimale_2298 [Volvox reticuliferus]|uniref:Uncharacterized protein n=1 Tax=Volvox reticuliferus TaxID=1737510 RepID=A0A8J4C7B4_9CHLO|nr:hypothetical protein Vretifemale_4584 [Volvox reticuliferus]GIL96505.1 hypothetical protein Vretimale_2298 [Volvox reticuliferus]